LINLKMDVPNALYLLNILEAAVLENGLEHLRHPPGGG